MFETICKPYWWEKGFYKANNIPEWETLTGITLELGIVYEKDDAIVRAQVTPMPAQFWKFDIHTTNGETLTLETGSGSLETFLPIAILFAQGILAIV